MPEQEIVCPYCGRKITLTEALIHPIKEKLQLEYNERVKELELDMKKRLQEEITKVKYEAEDRKRKLELEMARKLDEERKKQEKLLSLQMEEKYQLVIREKEKQLNDVKRQLEEATKKAEQVSQQLVGEVLELELEELLRKNFPSDKIEPIPKGFKGADVLQKVYTSSGQYCGIIIWETKRAKNWSDEWIEKLKEDQRRIKADIAILVTTTLPKNVSNFTYIDGVIVINYHLAVPFAILLRTQLAEITKIKQSTRSRDEKIQILYNYLTSPGFRQKIEIVVEAFINMKNDLDQEKRAMEKIWAKREKQISRALSSLVGMYGEMQGILGASLPEIKHLELPEFSSGTHINGAKENTNCKE